MVYTKFQRGNPVEANKAVFLAAPNLAEFAKELPPFNIKNLNLWLIGNQSKCMWAWESSMLASVAW